MRHRQRVFVSRRRWVYPVGCEREYQRFAKWLASEFRAAVKEELIRLQQMVHYNPLKQDGISEDILQFMQAIRRRFYSKADRLRFEAEIKKIAKQTNDFNYRQFRMVMRSALNVDIYQHEPWLRDLSEAWIAENVKLISKVPDDAMNDIGSIVSRGMMEGNSTDNMKDEILKKVDMADRRAQLIARDQVGKLNSDITKHRQNQCGIDAYQWSTSRDSRVRPEHAEREGKIFKWSDPPPDGHPGKAIYCRCVALPVIDLDKIEYIGMPGRR